MVTISLLPETVSGNSLKDTNSVQGWKVENADSNFYDKLKEQLFQVILEKIKNNEKVLDVGCGNCELVVRLAKEKNVKVIGVDIQDSEFKKTLQKVRGKVKGKVKCIKGDAENLKDFENASFSSVISKYSLHEFSNPSHVLKECIRVLKKQGKIILVDFIPDTVAEKLWGERYFIIEEIRNTMEKAGFQILEQKKLSIEGPVITVGIKG